MDSATFYCSVYNPEQYTDNLRDLSARINPRLVSILSEEGRGIFSLMEVHEVRVDMKTPLTGPELAMLRSPGEACLMLKFSSLNFRP